MKKILICLVLTFGLPTSALAQSTIGADEFMEYLSLNSAICSAYYNRMAVCPERRPQPQAQELSVAMHNMSRLMLVAAVNLSEPDATLETVQAASNYLDVRLTDNCIDMYPIHVEMEEDCTGTYNYISGLVRDFGLQWQNFSLE